MITTKHLSWREYLVEFLTSYLVVLVFGVALFKANSILVHIVTALAYGAIFLIFRRRMVTFGSPVLTLAMYSLRKLSHKAALALFTFQMAAATLAGATFYGIIDKMDERLAGATAYLKPTLALGVAEFIGGLVLVAGILALISQNKNTQEESVGSWSFTILVFTVFIVSSLLGSLGMVNPGTAFALHQYTNIALTIAPLFGGIVGAVVYMLVVEGKTFKSIFVSQKQS